MTAQRQLIDQAIGGDGLDEYVAGARRDGLSWEVISRKLAGVLIGTGVAHMAPTSTTLHRWYAHTEANK